ncbi:MAG: hypothetical protein O7H41_03650 [Planctomycetota bacterium]|nr:hypothetical protein [Planctomycetota bacterium]
MKTLGIAMAAMLLFGCSDGGNSSPPPSTLGSGSISLQDASGQTSTIQFFTGDHTFDPLLGSMIRCTGSFGWEIEILWSTDAPVFGDTANSDPEMTLIDPDGTRYVANAQTDPFGLMDIAVGASIFGTFPGDQTDVNMMGTLEDQSMGFEILHVLQGSVIATRE